MQKICTYVVNKLNILIIKFLRIYHKKQKFNTMLINSNSIFNILYHSVIQIKSIIQFVILSTQNYPM